MSSTFSFNWDAFPQEMRRTVMNCLSERDVWACARASHDFYSLCLPILFESVKLVSLRSVIAFLDAVPSHRYPLIRDLIISLPSTSDEHYLGEKPKPAYQRLGDPLAELLSQCTNLEALSISVCGPLASSPLLLAFKSLKHLKSFKLENLGQEDVPISERLVVSLAFSLPRLEDLALTRITRSARYASELCTSNVPVAQGDDDLPIHPILGDELRLPQLLRLPHLKRLKIRDTHLGDPQWAGPSLDSQENDSCPLEIIDLGSCPHIPPSANEAFTARILSRVPASITSCALSTSLPPLGTSALSSPCSSGSSSAGPSTPTIGIPSMPRLRTLHLTPLVPTSSISATLAQPVFSCSPVHTLACSFHPDDAADGYAALEAFLRERARWSSPAPVQAAIRRPLRKRASSKLSLSTQFEADVDEKSGSIFNAPVVTEEPEVISIDVDEVPTAPSSPFSPSQLYPSLSTLTIDIPEAPVNTLGKKLSARRLAAAQRRADERREAAERLQGLAKEIGLELILNGVKVKAAQVQGPAPMAKVPARARANTTF